KGDLECVDGQFSAKGNLFALNFDACEIGRSVFLRGRKFRADGGARLLGTRIGLVLDCHYARFDGWKSKEGVSALECERVTIGGAAFLVQAHFAGGVSFHNATIGGGLICHGGQFKYPGQVALDCSSATVSGRVDLSQGFVATGSVNLTGATIKGNLDCTNGRFDHAPGAALVMEDASISLSALMSLGCHVTGSVALQSAEIGRDLNCSGGRFESETIAIDCSNAEIGGEVRLGALLAAPGVLGAQFSATGQVNFRGASIGKSFNCRYGVFIPPPAEPDDASVIPG